MIPRSAYALEPGPGAEPPSTLESYVPLSAYQAWCLGHYGSGRSSRTTPTQTLPWPAGTWFIDECALLYGRFIEQLRYVDPAQVLPSETSWDRLPDVDRCAAWLDEGRTPPPVLVTVSDKGHLILGDGHRRRLAALRCGKPLLARVTDAVKAGLTYADGVTPQFTGLTFELVTGEVAIDPGADEGSRHAAAQRLRYVQRARAVW